jgi:hypothetical protein
MTMTASDMRKATGAVSIFADMRTPKPEMGPAPPGVAPDATSHPSSETRAGMK